MRSSLALGVFRDFGEYSDDPSTTLFWDGRVDNLHDQMIQTIGNPNEMGMNMDEVTLKIKDLEYYKILSLKAFGNENLTKHKILTALESFMKSITSTSSKFDVASISSNPSSNWLGYSAQENLGKNIFITNCVNCHAQGLERIGNFAESFRSANNGLDLV